MTATDSQAPKPLLEPERLHYRDLLREGRYAALADAEGFGQICFAVEALGLRLTGKQVNMNAYQKSIEQCSRSSPLLTELALAHPKYFSPFPALYEIVRLARNDNMHTGSYARHAAMAAIELCIGLEEALMSEFALTVSQVMVKAPVSVETWQLVAHARQLMLKHSFSFLPVFVEAKGWHLLSELEMARFLAAAGSPGKTKRLAMSISEAIAGTQEGAPALQLLPVRKAALLDCDTPIAQILTNAELLEAPALWLITEGQGGRHLAGVLSPFELM